MERIRRWLRPRAELLRRLDALEGENKRLREKLAGLQRAKDQAKRQVEERRREKEVLRGRLSSQRKDSETKELVTEQLSKKLAELRDENDRLLRSKKPE